MINAKCNRPKSLSQWLCELLKPRRPTPIVRNNAHWLISFHECRHKKQLLDEEHERGWFVKIKPSHDCKRRKCPAHISTNICCVSSFPPLTIKIEQRKDSQK